MSWCPMMPWWSSRGSRRCSPTRRVPCWPPCRCPRGPRRPPPWSVPGTGWWWSSRTSPVPCPTPRCCRRCWPNSNGPAPDPSGSSWCAPPAPTVRAAPTRWPSWWGPDIASRYRIRQHVADDGDHVPVGEVDGTTVLLDRHYVEADVRILTGFVEPHFFAGWSGGPKGACPGLAATSTILEAHSPRAYRRFAAPRGWSPRATRSTTSSGRPPRCARPSCPSTSPSTGAAG